MNSLVGRASLAAFLISLLTAVVGYGVVQAGWPPAWTVTVMLSVAVASAILGQAAANTVVRPLKALLVSIQRTQQEPPPAGPLEVARLAEAVESIRRQLQDQYRALQEERKRINGILAGLEDGVLVADMEGTVVYANPSTFQLLLCQHDELVGKRFEDGEVRDARSQVLAALRQSGELRDVVRIPEKDRHLTIHTFEIEGLDDTVGRVAVLHNVSDYVRVDRMRRKFVANASHELRTPVTALATALEALHLGAKDDPESRDAFLARASREADRLRELAEDLLDLTAAEENANPGGACDARSVANEVVERFSAVAAARQQTLSFSGGAPQPVGIAAGDLSRALGNVVENAIKYSPPGSTIQLGLSPTGDGVELTVTDNGPGIEPRYLHRIFERFYRIDKGRSRAVGGTGLGLSITRHLLERVGGSILAENAPGGGARFRMRLPRPVAAAQEAPVQQVQA